LEQLFGGLLSPHYNKANLSEPRDYYVFANSAQFARGNDALAAQITFAHHAADKNVQTDERRK